jgi:endonuclease YncB( thermonuclease family)
MKKLLGFWEKDIINKLIVLVLAVLVLGLAAFLYFLLTIPKGSIFYSAFSPSNDVIPTLASAATPMPTPTTASFPSLTPLPTFTPTLSLFSPMPSASPTFVSSPTRVQSTETAAPVSTSAALISNGSASACIPNNPPQIGKVVGVVDGNTIKVLLNSDGKIYVVRYIGIAVPKYGETQEPYGQKSELENYHLVFAQKINMFSDALDKDSAGRLLRYVTAGDNFINLALVQHGLATAVSASPNTACDSVFQNAEQSAQQSQVGMWSPIPTPKSP